MSDIRLSGFQLTLSTVVYGNREIKIIHCFPAIGDTVFVMSSAAHDHTYVTGVKGK